MVYNCTDTHVKLCSSFYVLHLPGNGNKNRLFRPRILTLLFWLINGHRSRPKSFIRCAIKLCLHIICGRRTTRTHFWHFQALDHLSSIQFLELLNDLTNKISGQQKASVAKCVQKTARTCGYTHTKIWMNFHSI